MMIDKNGIDTHHATTLECVDDSSGYLFSGISLAHHTNQSEEVSHVACRTRS